MRTGLLFICLLTLLSACSGTPSPQEKDVLVKVKERSLKRADVKRLIPIGLSSADSLLMAESITKKWIKEALVYDVALRNLENEKAEINQLVENYRRSLVQYRYQERLVKEKLENSIRESDMLHFYEANQKKFELDKNLIKGLFLKIPIDAPSLNDVKKWYKSDNESSLEKIEKYSVQNASIYDYFYDKWVDFEELMDNIPMQIANPKEFLRTHKFIEQSDSSYCYLLNIKEYLPAGSVAPYDYISPQIKEMLINQQKVEFIRDFEEELYNDAIRNGVVKFKTEP